MFRSFFIWKPAHTGVVICLSWYRGPPHTTPSYHTAEDVYSYNTRARTYVYQLPEAYFTFSLIKHASNCNHQITRFRFDVSHRSVEPSELIVPTLGDSAIAQQTAYSSVFAIRYRGPSQRLQLAVLSEKEHCNSPLRATLIALCWWRSSKPCVRCGCKQKKNGIVHRSIVDLAQTDRQSFDSRQTTGDWTWCGEQAPRSLYIGWADTQATFKGGASTAAWWIREKDFLFARGKERKGGRGNCLDNKQRIASLFLHHVFVC